MFEVVLVAIYIMSPVEVKCQMYCDGTVQYHTIGDTLIHQIQMATSFRVRKDLGVGSVTLNPSMRVTDPATLALSRLAHSSHCTTWSAKSELTDVPASTLWYCANGRRSREEKAEKQPYLTGPEEKAIEDFVLHFAKNGFPLPLKFLRSLAYLIVEQRSSVPLIHHVAKLPSAGWPRNFFK
jgi:hypothetical protein